MGFGPLGFGIVTGIVTSSSSLLIKVTPPGSATPSAALAMDW